MTKNNKRREACAAAGRAVRQLQADYWAEVMAEMLAAIEAAKKLIFNDQTDESLEVYGVLREAADKARKLCQPGNNPAPLPAPACPWCGAEIADDVEPTSPEEIDGDGEERSATFCPKCCKPVDVVRSLSLDRIEKRAEISEQE